MPLTPLSYVFYDNQMNNSILELLAYWKIRSLTYMTRVEHRLENPLAPLTPDEIFDIYVPKIKMLINNIDKQCCVVIFPSYTDHLFAFASQAVL